MLGIKLLGKLFLEGKPHSKGQAVVEAAKQVVTYPVGVGEPVISLAKSILETEDWEAQHRFSLNSSRYYVNLVKSGTSLSIPFQARLNWEIKWDTDCEAEWMTSEERRYIEGVYAEWEKLEAKRAEARKVASNAATRERFMRELVDHHGQLELKLS